MPTRDDRDIERITLAILGFGEPEDIARIREELSSDPLLKMTNQRSVTWHRRHTIFNRVIQSCIAILLLVLTAPLLLLIALGLAVTLRNVPFRRAKRIGKDGRVFYHVTFQCMYRIEVIRDTLDKLRETDSLARVPHDPRYSRFSHLVYRCGLAGLPSLVNIIVGDMTFIGPTTLFNGTLRELKEETRIDLDRYLSVPGLGGLHTVIGALCDADLFYVTHASTNLDLRILAAIVMRAFGVPRRSCLKWLSLPSPQDIPRSDLLETIAPVGDQMEDVNNLYHLFSKVYQRLSRNPPINTEQ